MTRTTNDWLRILCEAATADRYDGRMSDIRWAQEGLRDSLNERTVIAGPEPRPLFEPKPKPVPWWRKRLSWSGIMNREGGR